MKKTKKLEKNYCIDCGTSMEKVSKELNIYDYKTGKKIIKCSWRCPNAKKCHNQRYCSDFGHEDTFFGGCKVCGLSASCSLGAM